MHMKLNRLGVIGLALLAGAALVPGTAGAAGTRAYCHDCGRCGLQGQARGRP